VITKIGFLVIAVLLFGYGAFCVAAPRRAILLNSKDTILAHESADKPGMRLRYRLMGIAFMAAGVLAVLGVTSGVISYG
jgi:hypothetical protein